MMDIDEYRLILVENEIRNFCFDRNELCYYSYISIVLDSYYGLNNYNRTSFVFDRCLESFMKVAEPEMHNGAIRISLTNYKFIKAILIAYEELVGVCEFLGIDLGCLSEDDKIILKMKFSC